MLNLVAETANVQLFSHALRTFFSRVSWINCYQLLHTRLQNKAVPHTQCLAPPSVHRNILRKTDSLGAFATYTGRFVKSGSCLFCELLFAKKRFEES